MKPGSAATWPLPPIIDFETPSFLDTEAAIRGVEMASNTAGIDYQASQKIVHWLMAILIILDLFVAQKFGGLMEDADRIQSRIDHSQIGMIVTVLFVLRIFLRMRYGAPPLPEAMPGWQKLAAHAAHWGLYLLIGTLILSGMLSAVNANSVIAPFGLFAFGDGAGEESTFLFFRGIHEFITNAIIALIVVHVLAAFYHLVIARDGSTERMLRFWRSARQSA